MDFYSANIFDKILNYRYIYSYILICDCNNILLILRMRMFAVMFVRSWLDRAKTTARIYTKFSMQLLKVPKLDTGN